MWYKVTTQRTDLKIHIDPDINSRVIGGLEKDHVYEFEESRRGRWMKLKNRAGWAYSGDRDREPFLTLDNSYAPSEIVTAPPSPARRILLFFGGAGDRFPPGARMTPNDANGPRTSQITYDLLTVYGQFDDSYPINSAIANDTTNAAVRAGLDFLEGLWRELSGPPDKLVIYGFSAGGFNAVQLCKRLVEFDRQVDLLITVDPCIERIDPAERVQLKRPGRHVVKHVNLYQRRGATKGRSIVTADVDERRYPPPGPLSAHDQMPLYTLVNVQPMIGEVLGQAAAVRP